MGDKAKSGDGLGAYGVTPGPSGAADLRAKVDAIIMVNGTATGVTNAVRASISARVYSLFGATTKESRDEVDMAMTYYFSVHGTSPGTDWSIYGAEYPVVAGGKSVLPIKLVGEIGQHRLKKFMGQFSELAMAMVEASPDFRRALSERAARANLAPGQEHLAIDFLGKDGSLSSAENRTRVAVRATALNYRAGNSANVSQTARESDTVPASKLRQRMAEPMLSFE